MGQATAFIALNRFGLGARAGEARQIGGDPCGWVLDQVTRGEAQPIRGTADSKARFHALDAFRRAKAVADKADAEREADKEAAGTIAASAPPTTALATPGQAVAAPGAPADPKPPSPLDNPPGRIFDTDLVRRAEQMAASDTPVIDRLAAFWCNHFAVSGTRDEILILAVPYENEAIRPAMLGNFRDLLMASATHPAMTLYLDAAASVGPDSEFGRRQHRAVNENYARELMELHTLGVTGGYTQRDVQELALALTGLGLADGEGAWFFDRHEPGDRVLLGRALRGSRDQMVAAFDILANHPATIRHVCGKLAAHICGDQPPRGVVARMAQAWRGSSGNLRAVTTALAASPEAWTERPTKYRTPQDFVLASARGIGVGVGHGRDLLHEMRILGHAPFQAPSPSGWPDQDEDWLQPGGVTARVGSARRLAGLAHQDVDAAGLMAQLASYDPHSPSLDVVLAEPAPRRALALVLASPEMQRR